MKAKGDEHEKKKKNAKPMQPTKSAAFLFTLILTLNANTFERTLSSSVKLEVEANASTNVFN